MHQNHDRHFAFALWHRKPADELYVMALKFGIADIKGDAFAACTCKNNLAMCTIRKRNLFAIGPLGPAKGAGPCAIRALGQCARCAIKAAPAQRGSGGRCNIHHRAITQAVRTDVTIGSRSGGFSSMRERRGEKTCAKHGANAKKVFHGWKLGFAALLFKAGQPCTKRGALMKQPTCA
jgi:hypothetical protein